jgi:hypothetical protein
MIPRFSDEWRKNCAQALGGFSALPQGLLRCNKALASSCATFYRFC